MTSSLPNILEEQIRNIFTLIDKQVLLSAQKDEPLPYYDLNELLKEFYEQCDSPLHLSIKFDIEHNTYGEECDLNGNYFSMIWLYKHRKQLGNFKRKTRDNTLSKKLELYGLWKEDYEELEEIDIDNIESLDAYTIDKETKEIILLKF